MPPALAQALPRDLLPVILVVVSLDQKRDCHLPATISAMALCGTVHTPAFITQITYYQAKKKAQSTTIIGGWPNLPKAGGGHSPCIEPRLQNCLLPPVFVRERQGQNVDILVKPSSPQATENCNTPLAPNSSSNLPKININSIEKQPSTQNGILIDRRGGYCYWRWITHER